MNAGRKFMLYMALWVLPVCTRADGETYVYEEIARLPWGSSSGAVGLIPEDEEQEAQGPDAIAVDASGRIYLLDVVNFRVQQYSAEGDLLRSMPLEIAGHALCVTEEGMLYVLDPFTNAIVQYDHEGHLVEAYTFTLPPQLSGDLPITRIVEGPDGRIWLGTYRDTYPVELISQTARVGGLRKGIPGVLTGTYYVIERIHQHRARLLLRDEEGDERESLFVDSKDPIASLVFLRTDSEGYTYIVLETFKPSSDGAIAIGKEALKLKRTGEVVARFELTIGYTYCYGGDVAVGDDGSLYHLWTQPDGVHIVKWHTR